MPQINDQIGVRTGWEGVTMESHSISSRQLRKDAGIFKKDSVVAGVGNFGGVRKAGDISFPRCARRELKVSNRRHNHDVSKTSDTGSSEVCVAESDDGGVTIVIAGTSVPTVGSRVGA